ncbi:V-type ATP synthase subunit D [Acetobacterium woodii]|uniref:V-type ATP synthase subunit D n=1 Tax=Acetobacterium woodii (strain ATCC 29683 / DSM 1030 / JCM 2381 / KCTC 1655 / WB1) TaxID=931626 RepID=H6LDB7_ACEWD|nr:V-type ATP synthase subunit D [Acetobacterium woodii]AFA49162.1 V-ATPase D-subunit VatD [Acetobacterium woodii DSM 1030]
MAIKITPTKANLIKAKGRLNFSEKGYDLLDKKRTILIQEIMQLVKEAELIEKEIGQMFREAYEALQQVCISMGLNHLEEFTLSVVPEMSFEIRAKSVMGVDIPEVIYTEKNEKILSSGFYENNPALDIAIRKFDDVKHLSYQLAQVETTAYKLSLEIKKTQKSANALDKIQIPRLKEEIKYIQDTIEEKEREEFFRLKKVKNKR